MLLERRNLFSWKVVGIKVDPSFFLASTQQSPSISLTDGYHAYKKSRFGLIEFKLANGRVAGIVNEAGNGYCFSGEIMRPATVAIDKVSSDCTGARVIDLDQWQATAFKGTSKNTISPCVKSTIAYNLNS